MHQFLIAVYAFAILSLSHSIDAATKPHAVIVVGTHHYSPHQTMPRFASELDRLGFRTTVINPEWNPEKDERGLPGLEALADADVAVFYLRFLKLDESQLEHIMRFVESGKPVVGLRTSTHAFNYPDGHPHQALNIDFGRDVLGTPYQIHLGGKTQVKLAHDAASHPILSGVNSQAWESPGTLYLVDAEPGVQPLLVGTGRSRRVGEVANQFGTHVLEETMSAPVAWTWTNKWNGRVFATSLGHAGDFANENSLRVLVNGVFWAADQPVPSATTSLKAFAPAASKSNTKKKGRPSQSSEKKPESARRTEREDRTDQKPNVIIVMTDDQGYGDLACHGNPDLKTPHLDRLHAESVRFTDFHVSSFCTPTRAALLTGNYPGVTGAFRTSSGRTMMHRDEKTIANLFSNNGYATGMVGKWHLGDNAPHRPQDRGFQDVVWHRCGGVGQASDYWGNDYFDDTYERNGKFEKFEGYCTDVWFREAMRFVDENQSKPFMLYLATNAPHGPYRVPAEWAKPYVGNRDVTNPNFFGMIANLDHNLGRLREHLAKLGLAKNTILVFMTDNGTSAGFELDRNDPEFGPLDSLPVRGFNAGMRGRKSSVYEGGHRVPFFVHWPNGELTGGRDVDTLAGHIDVLPTLADLCGLSVSEQYNPDGLSLKPLLYETAQPWSRTHLVEQYLGGAGGNDLPPKRSEYSVVMSERWRLVNSGQEGLYDIQADPSQSKNVASDHPETVRRLRAVYEPYWDKVSPRLKPVRIDVGNAVENPTVLCSQDWYMPNGNPPWNFNSIKKLPKVTGPWMLEVKKPGRYRLTLRQYPKEANQFVVAERAKIEIAGQTFEQPVEATSKGVVFDVDLPAGPTELVTYLYDKNGKAGGAYFTEVEAL